MKKVERLQFIDQTLERLYPDPVPPLNFESNYQLLVAVVLSAQCTDERVNIVTAKLFAEHPEPQDVLALGVEGLIPYIRTCGLFITKAKNIISMTADLLDQYLGSVPDDFDALVSLAGVGEKTAGVIMAQAFGKAAFPVDTHIHRLAHRLGLSKAKGPSAVSRDLKKAFPEDRWADLHLQVIFHGRQVCMVRKPNCWECPLLEVCPEGRRRTK
jgi:endonuclease-3